MITLSEGQKFVFNATQHELKQHLLSKIKILTCFSVNLSRDTYADFKVTILFNVK